MVPPEAKSLNSIVYCCFGIFIVLPFMVTAILRHPWKTKFLGKLTLTHFLARFLRLMQLGDG